MCLKLPPAYLWSHITSLLPLPPRGVVCSVLRGSAIQLLIPSMTRPVLMLVMPPFPSRTRAGRFAIGLRCSQHTSQTLPNQAWRQMYELVCPGSPPSLFTLQEQLGVALGCTVAQQLALQLGWSGLVSLHSLRTPALAHTAASSDLLERHHHHNFLRCTHRVQLCRRG